jgi:DNA-binding beta-propeller fold protein YncE
MSFRIKTFVLSVLALAPSAVKAAVQDMAPSQPYRVIRSERVGGPGGWDYVFADSDNRRLYIPRGDRITVFDLDSLKAVASIPGSHGVHGVAVDPVSHHAFSSSQPLLMWDSRTLAPIKTIAVQGNPDGILFESATERVYILSHRAPYVTVIDARDGAIVGTIDVGGAPEQAVSDGRGRVYVDVEDKDSVAVIDVRSLQVTGHFDLAGKGGGPAGLALDAENGILFAFCRNPATAVILDAGDGHLVATLPIGRGVDGAGFNPETHEAFGSQGDGTLTVIKEQTPAQFEVEQTVSTKAGARTSTLDRQTGHILLVTADRASSPPTPVCTPASEPRHERPSIIPDTFTILMVGK